MNLLRAASTVSLWTLASRITGLVRETLVAYTFGASAFTDAFQVAFRIPNLLRRLFGEGAFAQAFVPILAATRAQQGDESTRRLVDAVATVLAWALLLTCVAGVLAAPLLVWLMASGLPPDGFDAAVVMARWMFPYIGLISLVALSAGILNTWKQFAIPAATPVLLNLAFIAAAWLLAPRFASWGIPPIYALAAGVMIGGVLQLALQVPALARLKMLPRIGLGPSAVRAALAHEGVRRVLRQMGPAVLGVSVAQLSLIINTHIASYLRVGSVSWITYADRLMEFPTALLGVALSVVLLPQLSAARAKADDAAYSGMLDWGLRLVLLLALPCAVALLVIPGPLVAVLFHYGQFHAGHVRPTELALMGYGVGLLGLVAIKVLAPGYYAQHDMRTPVKIALVVLVLTQLLNALLVPWLEHAGLTLSIGLAALVNALWLLVGLRRRGSYRPVPGWAAFTVRVVVASAAMGAALWLVRDRIDWLGLQAHWLLRAAWLLALISGAVALYFVTLLTIGLKLRPFIRRA